MFIVACKRLAKKEDGTFEERKDYIEKIWRFTDTYINGLNELTRNVVEHSGQNKNNGQGMITIRAYSGMSDNNEKIKVLETHIFDYGKSGIYETLMQNTKKNITSEDDIYKQDFDILTDSKSRYTIKDFIEPIDNKKFLLQQFYREMAHYGLMNFKHLIEQHEGKIIASSVRKENDNDRERYVFTKYSIAECEINDVDIAIGTSYYFEMPFIPSLFKIKFEITQELNTQFAIPDFSVLRNILLLNYTKIEKLQDKEKKIYNRLQNIRLLLKNR